MDALKQSPASRIFRAWIEDWEKDLLQDNDCVAEAKILEKYKNLVFYDPDTELTYTTDDGGLEFHRKDRKRNIDKGWAVIANDPDGETEIGDMVCC